MKADLNSAKIDIEHKYFLLAIELQRFHIEFDKLLGVVTEFQQQLTNAVVESESLTAVVDKCVKDIQRIISELNEPNFDETDKCEPDRDIVSTAAVALQQENSYLRLTIDQVQREKKVLEQQLACVEEMIVVARELKDENEGMIHDFRSLKDSITVEQETDALEIVELTKSFKQLIANNEMLRQKNEELTARMRQFEQANVQTDATGVDRSETSEDGDTHGVVSIVMKNQEVSQLDKNVERMDHEMTKTTTVADVITTDTCLQEQQTDVNATRRTETTADDDRSDAGNRETADKKPEGFPLPVWETVSTTKRTSRQTSEDSGTLQGRYNSLGDSGMQRSMSWQSELANADLVGLSSAMEQLLAENDRLRSELTKLTAASASTKICSEDQDESFDVGDSAKTSSLRHHAAQLESEITALKRTVKEQSIYLGGRHPDDGGSESAWPQPYEGSNLTTDVDEGEELDNEKNEDGTVSMLRLMKEEMKAVETKWSSYETSRADETRNQLQQEATILRDQQLTLLDELASKTKQIEDFEELARHQRTADEIADNYWSIFDEVDSRRTRLNQDGGDLYARRMSEQRTMQVFGLRLERWLNDYETLISERNVQRTNDSIYEDQTLEMDDTATERLSERQRDHQSQLDVSGLRVPLERMTHPEELGGKVKENDLMADSDEAGRQQMETSLEQAQLTSDVSEVNLEKLQAELKAKEEELRRKNEQVNKIQIENEALKSAASSSSPFVYIDYEEQIERLALDRSMLLQRLQEAQFEAEEMREELAGENERLCRQLDMLKQHIKDQRTSADNNVEDQRTSADNNAEDQRTSADSNVEDQRTSADSNVEDQRTSADSNAEALTTENRRLHDQLSKLEADRHSVNESHRTQLEESMERLRATEDNALMETGRLVSELAVVTAERSQLRDSCAKFEKDCLAFQELSSEMVERCERLTIELERLRQNRAHNASGDSCTFHIHHEYCQRSAEQARREIEALQDENTRLAMVLEMERLKNFNDARPTAIDNVSQTDLEPRAIQLSASTMNGNLKRDVDSTDGAGETGLDLLGHAEAAHSAALQLRHLLTVGRTDVDGQERKDIGVEDSTHQLTSIVEELAAELDSLMKSLTMTIFSRRLTDVFSLQAHDRQQLVQV